MLKLGYELPGDVIGFGPNLFEFIVDHGVSQAFEMVLVHPKDQGHDALGVRHGFKEVLAVISHGVPRQIDKPGIIRPGGKGH